MQHKLIARFWAYSMFVTLLSLLIGWGCRQGVPVIPQPQPPSASQPDHSSENASQLPSSFRFGVVYYPFADVYAQPDAGSERLTQCIYGDVVRIVEENRWWYGVRIGPYPELSGWVHKTGVTVLSANALYLKERNLKTIVIRQDESQVFIWPSHSLSISMGTELPFIGETDAWYLVRLPTNDIGRIAKESASLAVVFQPLIHAKQAPSMQPAQPMKPVKLTQPAKPAKSAKPRQAEKSPTPDFVVIPEHIPQQRHEIVITARRFLGKTYVWGGTTPRGFDCSGLSFFVYKLNGIELPRISWLQFRDEFGKKITKSQLTYGDLVFFQTYRQGPSHVGIYIGNNQFIHASPTSGVTTSNLDDPYFKKRYIGAKTIFAAS
jgi:cell wall-associated NlpC family hydrolase